MPVYYARPANAQSPPVILVAMEIFGLHEYIKDVVRRLGKLGALAVAPDYYFRKGVDLTKIADMPQLMPIVNAKPDSELLSDLDATVAWAKSQGGDTNRLGIIGFCRGGRTAVTSRCTKPLRGREPVAKVCSPISNCECCI
jgi:carboxymethylenebutenolidase